MVVGFEAFVAGFEIARGPLMGSDLLRSERIDSLMFVISLSC